MTGFSLSLAASFSPFGAASPALCRVARRNRLGRALAALLHRNRYQPERHYMRGGHTEGSRSLARARLIAGG